MALFFYLVDCANRNPPVALQAVEYVHVKAKTDGLQIIAITEENINDPACDKKTKTQAQILLDSWIDAENAIALVDPVSNEVMLQSKISLDSFLEE